MIDTQKKKIIVLDDDPDMRIFLTTILEGGGFDSIMYKADKDGLKQAKEKRPDLIILDITWGQRNTCMYWRIRKDDHLRHIPVVMLSSVSKEMLFRYRKMNGSSYCYSVPEPEAYIEKPPEAEELLSIVHRLLGIAHQS